MLSKTTVAGSGRGPGGAWVIALAMATTSGLASCTGGSGVPDSAPAPEDLNVVLVSIDTLRADRLNAYGYDARRTSPNLDALAREGILFENFITAAPWTTPAHLSLITSLHPSTHGVIEPFDEMSRKLFGGGAFLSLAGRRVTLAEVLQAEGFRTAAFTAGGPLDPKLGFGQGFEEYATSMYKLDEENVGEMLAWVERHRESRFFLFWHHFEVHAPYLQADFVDDVLARRRRHLAEGGDRGPRPGAPGKPVDRWRGAATAPAGGAAPGARPVHPGGVRRPLHQRGPLRGPLARPAGADASGHRARGRDPDRGHQRPRRAAGRARGRGHLQRPRTQGVRGDDPGPPGHPPPRRGSRREPAFPR